MRTTLLALSSMLMMLCGCEFITEDEGPAEELPTNNVANDSEGPKDCVMEDVEDPLNIGTPLATTVIRGGVCQGFDEFIVNVSSMCTIQAQLTFDEDKDDMNMLVADGLLELRWAGSRQLIGEASRSSSQGKVTQTNNPEDDSFGAVRVRVVHTSGAQLDYALTLSTMCPS